MDAPEQGPQLRSRLRVLGDADAESQREQEHTADSEYVAASVVRASSKPASSGHADEEVLDTLVANNGIVVRVAALLEMTEAQVINVVGRNAGSLSTKLRSRLMLSSFVTVVKLDAVLQASAADLPLDTLGRTYAASLAAFSNLAGQFEESSKDDDTDDAEAAKTGMIERLERMGKREQAERALQSDEAVG